MKTSLIMIVLAASVAGCGTMDGLTFENRIACSVANDKAFVVSEYGGWVGISSKISDKDMIYVCPGAR